MFEFTQRKIFASIYLIDTPAEIKDKVKIDTENIALIIIYSRSIDMRAVVVTQY
jgi:hypothetical protein